MYPYYSNPWQFMAQQSQSAGYQQPTHPMHQYQMMPMMALQGYNAAPQIQHMHPSPQHYAHPQAPMPPMMPMMQPMVPMFQHAPLATMQPVPQIAPPPLQHAPQPLPPVPMEPAHPLSTRQNVDQFIQKDEDDFDQERYDAIKARIRKLRGTLRETV